SQMLVPPLQDLTLQPGQTVTFESIEHVLDVMYATVSNGRAPAVLRLLIADGQRVPHLAQRWQNAFAEPYVAAIGALVRRGVAQGTLRPGILAEQPWLLVAPVLFSTISQMVFPGPPGTREQ
ncbi:MAG TPA: TetR-like C-terminal domain-containing protein, partial [Burkholderiaceae bacterium]